MIDDRDQLVANSSISWLIYFSFRQKNTGQNGGKPRLDLNVESAWAQGVTGKNVTTAIMDDGKLRLELELETSIVFISSKRATVSRGVKMHFFLCLSDPSYTLVTMDQ